jgi:hypothetical protein
MQVNQITSRAIQCLVCFLLIFFFFNTSLSAQSLYLQQGAKENIIAERLEILGQKDSNLNFSKTRYLNRKQLVTGVLGFRDKHPAVKLSKTDDYNIQGVYRNSIEYLPGDLQQTIRSKKPVLKYFYTTPANLYEVHVKDFDLVVNPIIQFQYLKEQDHDETLFLNSRGVGIRGRIAGKIGFAASIIENQERDPLYVQDWEDKFKSVPGAGYYKNFKGTGYDYFDARGYFTFNVTRYIDVAFGYDRNFIGNGYRSLFLSDFGANMLFLKLNTRIWKLNYQNLFVELNTAEPRGPDRLLPKKYGAFHHLDVNITRSLNIGLFEGIVFGRKDHFEFGYLNPVIFYRSIEQQNGSADNSVAGLDFKANFLKQFQVYGQFMLDEFNLGEIRKKDGWWGNKWGVQLGAKYVNMFGIKNLDLQVEQNWVRPFTYSHRDSVANFTHYNQPMVHPLGANFSETIGILRYQPMPKWTVIGKMMHWKQGVDSGFRNFGSNIFRPNRPPYRIGDYGYEIGSGLLTKTTLASLYLGYELKENLYLEASVAYRKYDVPAKTSLSGNTTIISAGIRWNMHRRNFDF